MATKTVHNNTGVQNILQRAKQLGYETNPQEPKGSEGLVGKVEQLHTLMKETASFSNEIEQRSRLIGNPETDTGPSLEQMNSLLADLIAHLERVVEQKDVLVSYVQLPFTGESIAVEYENQHHLKQLFKQMVESISALPTHVAAVDWAAKFTLQDRLLDKRLSQLSTYLAKCQRLSDTLSNLRQSMLALADGK